MKPPKGVKIEFESEEIKYLSPSTYNPDFIVTKRDGSKLYIEVKGWFRPEDKKKMANVKKCNPDLDIRMIFPKKDKRNERWCHKHKYPFAINETPKEWFE